MNSDEEFEERCLPHAAHYCMKCLNENRAAELAALRAELAAANQRALMAQLDDSLRDELAAVKLDLAASKGREERLRSALADSSSLLVAAQHEPLEAEECEEQVRDNRAALAEKPVTS